jgi:3-dehydroquinate dehydratase type I
MICASVVASTMKEALNKMKKGFPLADLLEIRVDHIRDLDLETLLKAKKGGLLVTNRSRKEGGAFAGTEPERIRILIDAVSLGADYVDVEAGTDRMLMEELRRAIGHHGGRTRLIVSYHNFRRTPSLQTLQRKVDECIGCGADIVKIVTTAWAVEDNLRVLGLIPYVQKKGKKAIAFCMGEKGRISRIAAPLMGACLTFASLKKGEESAPGQLTAAAMRCILRLLQSSEDAES